MNKINKSFIVLILFIFFAGKACAQNNDAGLWMSLNAEKKITHLFSINLSQEFRMNENITELGNYFSDIGINYKLSKNIKFSANYRFTNKRQKEGFYSKRHRYYFDLSIRKKIKPLIFLFRTRFQSQYADMYSSSEGTIPSYYSRNKLTIKFNIKNKITSYIYTELFIPLNKYNSFYIDNARYCGGIEYEINRKNSFNFFYMIQKEYNVKCQETDYIMGVEYNFQL